MRKIGKILCVIASIVFICIAIIPSLLSTSWGTSLVSQIINHSIPGKVSFRNISLGWFSRQKIESLTLSGSHGDPILAIKELDSDASLLALLFKPGNRGMLRIIDAQGTIVQDQNG